MIPAQQVQDYLSSQTKLTKLNLWKINLTNAGLDYVSHITYITYIT